MRQLRKALCIKAAPSIRPITEGDRHIPTHLSFSSSASLPRTKQNSEHFYFKSNYFTLNCNQMIASSNRKCVFLCGCACVRGVCVSVWVCGCVNCCARQTTLWKLPTKWKSIGIFPFALWMPFFFLLFYFCFFFSQAEHRSRHTRTTAKDICVANEIFNIATRWTWIQ